MNQNPGGACVPHLELDQRSRSRNIVHEVDAHCLHSLSLIVNVNIHFYRSVETEGFFTQVLPLGFAQNYRNGFIVIFIIFYYYHYY